MNTRHHPMGRALQAGAGLAVLAAFAHMIGCLSADPAGEPGRRAGASIGEGAEAVTAGIYRCASGRRGEGSLVVHPNGTCVQYTSNLAGASGQYCDDDGCLACRDLSRRIGCLLISRHGEPLGLAPGTRLYRCTVAGGTMNGTLVIRPDATCTSYDIRLAGASDEHCPEGVCPSCWALGRDLGCHMTP
ncbi:uncharacterized protein SOCEGT47_080030 [Sorangium cellulosum]|uniref:Uncharacterized protein n=2 Tax=Polyangiaceae TaxID=49 RepID=A0A4P2QCD8_SORCE|nr:uncharacterized protein SOCEGT47_080030 [Sorangium cellulosum]